VLITPAVRRNKPAPSQPPRKGCRGKGQCLWIRRRCRHCRRRAAERRSGVGSSGSTTTRRRRRPFRRWSGGLLAVRTVGRPLPTVWPSIHLRLLLGSREHRCRLVGREGGLPRPTAAQTCKCSTYVFHRCFFYCSFVPLARRRMSTLAMPLARGRVSRFALLKTRPRRPQSSLRLQPCLRAPRSPRPRHRLR
jgi:hypothetical protein